MTLRRMFVGLGVVLALSVWALARPDDSSHPVQTVEPPIASSAAAGGNYDEASHHYRNGHARHWRHVMIGGH